MVKKNKIKMEYAGKCIKCDKFISFGENDKLYHSTNILGSLIYTKHSEICDYMGVY